MADTYRQGRTKQMDVNSAVRNLARFEQHPTAAARKLVSFISRCIFRTNIPNYNHIMLTNNGPAHILSNLVQDMVSLWSNDGQLQWTPTLMNLEHGNGRLLG